MHNHPDPDRLAGPVNFPLGQLLMTQGVQAEALSGRLDPQALLRRHARGDWGDICAEDQRENELAVDAGLRLLSSYRIDASLTVWVITEADRSVTTLLLPSEY